MSKNKKAVFWAVRNKHNKALHLFLKKPKWNEKEGYWEESGHWRTGLPYNLFPDVTFENSPQKVEIKLTDLVIKV